jgi:16S rRNA (uracil1498-N3)-methyltransferase
MELFYTPCSHIDLKAGKLGIEGDEFHHLSRVTRKKPGERILVTDGHGLRCEVMIDTMGKKSLDGTILGHSFMEKPATEVAVALSLLRNPQRFDFFIEKATELGVSLIIPMITTRTVSLPSDGKIGGKLFRWRNIVLSAAKQSKRYYFPGIEAPLSFSKVTHLEGFDNRLIACEGSLAHHAVAYSGKKTLFLIGGEGGFSQQEIEEAGAAGFSEVTLGKTILRAETAGIFALAMVRVNLLSGDTNEWM